MKRSIKKLLRNFLDNLPYISSLRRQVGNQGLYPAGHFYSPIPNHDDVLQYLNSFEPKLVDLPDIDLNPEAQFTLLQEFAKYYDDLPFPEQKRQYCRYYYDQGSFCYADAIFLYSFIRKNQPKRIIEVGSGFSSAVILDTLERFSEKQTDICFIDPYPDRLISVLRPQDKEKIRIIDSKVQDTQNEVFASLGPGDLLFIDSTLVVKCGSDVQFLMFEIIPKLSSGVYVHFHDVFFPFEYPSEWLANGRYWNEDYFLRAFLAYNSEWSIYFFNSFVALAFKDFLKGKMPLCLKNPGGSIYIQKVKEG